jgi:hypothetical protein
LMTTIAEVSIAPELNHNVPAEPLSNTTAKLTFKLNIFFTMFGTVLDRNLTTVRTDKLLRFKVSLPFVHSVLTSLSTTKIWFFTFKALIVRKHRHGIL